MLKAKLWMPFGGETGLMDSLEDRDCKAGGTVGWGAVDGEGGHQWVIMQDTRI